MLDCGSTDIMKELGYNLATTRLRTKLILGYQRRYQSKYAKTKIECDTEINYTPR
jgi:hypothetical protein